jgi:hypothetical protein
MSVSSEPAFPTEGIVPEHRQIGRISAIEGLTKRLLEPHHHWALIDQRRVGKSSVAHAAIARLGDIPEISAVAIDLRQLSIGSEADLVRELVKAGKRTGIEIQSKPKQVAAGIRDLLKGKTPAVVEQIGAAVGSSDLEDAAKVAEAFADLVGRQGELNLFQLLLAFEAWGIAHQKSTVVFMDEVQDLARWSDGGLAVDRLAAAMRWPLTHVRLLFAGSEKHAMTELFASGRALRENTLDFELPPIAREDWLHALPERFSEMGFTVDPDALHAVVDSTRGRPLRTNQVCLQAVMNAPDYQDDDRNVSLTIMNYALTLVARRDNWEDDGDDDE